MQHIWINSTDALKDTMETKELRACPHRFEILRPYKYLCWHDSKFDVFVDKVIEAQSILESNDELCMALTRHPCTFTTVWDEYNLCIKYDKYAQQKDQYKRYIESRLCQGYSEHINTIFVAVLDL